MPLFLLAGCQDASDDRLEVKKFNVWNMPADGKHIPGPRSIAVGPDDQIVVLDNGGRLLIFDPDGKLLRKWNMPSNEVGNPEGACWLKDGRIAVADTHYHRVLFFDQEGKLVGKIGKDSVPGTQLQPGGPSTFIYPVSVVQDDQEISRADDLVLVQVRRTALAGGVLPGHRPRQQQGRSQRAEPPRVGAAAGVHDPSPEPPEPPELDAAW